MDPYKAPSATEPSTGPGPKPWRLWVLQGYATLQLLLVTGGLVFALVDPRTRPLVDWSTFFIKVVPASLLVLSLQRILKPSQVIAPAMALIWWSYWTYVDIQHFRHPVPGPLDQYKFQDATPGSEMFASCLFRCFWLFIVLSTVLSEPCRRYLSGKAAMQKGPEATKPA
jgi:hypothetical protein